MKMTRNALIVLAIIFALTAAGCGGGGDGDGHAPSTSYLPMRVGNTWTYLMTFAPDIIPLQAGENQLFDYHETIIGTAALDGTEYFLFRSVREATDEYPERNWQQIRRETGDAILARLPIYDETGQVIVDSYDLPVLTLPPRQGATWANPEFPEITFTIAAVGEQVSVPAGTFSCVRVEESWEEPVEDGSPILRTNRSWFSRGVGLVKDETWEDDAKTTMIELTEYTLN
ncbi:MAG: hypothetical protein ACOX9R_16415 [Armatimonadota bacterium]|jgi:hypothetical protein